MAPEITVDKLQSADISQLKSIDVWALLMTFWIILNPDQQWPFEMDQNSDKKPIEYFLRSKKTPSPSKNYLKMQACELAVLRNVFYSNLDYNPTTRKTASTIVSFLSDVKDTIEVEILDISQETA